MREIKFRAWLKKEKIIVDVLELIHNGRVGISVQDSGPFIRQPEEIELMQFTGLKDKNGNDVYEGYIFKCIYDFDGCSKHLNEIAWSDKTARFYLKPHGEDCHQPAVEIDVHDMTRMEIIGNIYQNPDLIAL